MAHFSRTIALRTGLREAHRRDLTAARHVHQVVQAMPIERDNADGIRQGQSIKRGLALTVFLTGSTLFLVGAAKLWGEPGFAMSLGFIFNPPCACREITGWILVNVQANHDRTPQTR